MLYPISSVRLIDLPFDSAENGDLTIIEGMDRIPFSIARVFVVRGQEGSIRGEHAHKFCTQFLTCPHGSIEVCCTDGSTSKSYLLNRPDVGLLIPPSIWAHQNYLVPNSVLTVLCDRPYEAEDYIRDRGIYMKHRNVINSI
jgi:hypothetical protein